MCWDVSFILYDIKCNYNAFLLPTLKVVEFARRIMINTYCCCVILVNFIIILVAWIHLLQGCQGRPRTVTGKNALDDSSVISVLKVGHKCEYICKSIYIYRHCYNAVWTELFYFQVISSHISRKKNKVVKIFSLLVTVEKRILALIFLGSEFICDC